MHHSNRIAALTAAALLALSVAAEASPPRQVDPYQDIQKTLGFVPGFFRAITPDAVAAWWDQMKALEMNPRTALPNRVKELIGLAVAAQIPCTYCVYFHTRASLASGASRREQEEAVAMAATTRHWSAIANGNQLDEREFRTEVDAILVHGSRQKNPPAARLAAVVDAPSARRDIERVLGRVPGFLRRYPPAALAPAWRVLRSVELNPATSLPAKEKELIGLAVASQIPCAYCVYFHTRAARASGASEQEVQEAIAMAALTRFGSAILWGGQVDEASFRNDIDRIYPTPRPAR